MPAPRLLAALLFAALLVPAPAFADNSTESPNRAQARELTVQGYKALDAKNHAAAQDFFTRADILYASDGDHSHAPTITLGLARAYAGQGKLLQAQEAYSRTVHTTLPANASASFKDAVKEAQSELDALKPRVPAVILDIKVVDGLKVMVDGAVIPNAALGVRRPMDPGKHVVHAEAPSHAPSDATVVLVEGKTETLDLVLKASAAPKPTPPVSAPPVVGPVAPREPKASSSTQRTLGFVGLGVGAAGIVVGAVTGGLALAKHGSLTTSCPDGHCAPGSEGKHQSDIDAYNAMGAASTGGFIAGGVLAATGVILLVTAPKATKSASIAPVVSAGYLGLQGRF